MCRIRWPAFLALLLVLLLAPAPALANEVDVLGGFSRGFGDLVSPDAPDSGFERTELVGDGQLRAAPSNEYEQVVNSLQIVRIGQGRLPWIQALRWLLDPTYNNTPVSLLIVPTAVILVFFWWGVRKSKNVIIRVFKGKQFRL